MNKKNISLLMNIVIVILEIVGLYITYSINKRMCIEFYTEDSNIFALISSLLYVIFLFSNKKIPLWLKRLKYLSTSCVALTFFVVILILAPMYNFDYVYVLTKDSMLYHHLLCPILCMISFICFDDIKGLKKKDVLFSISFTIFYAILMIILNLVDVIKGPYPFLMVKEQNIFVSFMWLIIIPGLSYLLSLLLHKNSLKYNKEK